MTTVDEFLAELQAAGLADKTLNELKAKKLRELEKEVEALRKGEKAADAEIERLRADNEKLVFENEKLVSSNERLRDENVVLGEKASEACDALREIERVDGEELAALKAENAELRERCKAIAADADNWKRLACTSDRDLGKPVAGEMDAAEREHWERGKDITGCDV